jgi:hypothetical protein
MKIEISYAYRSISDDPCAKSWVIQSSIAFFEFGLLTVIGFIEFIIILKGSLLLQDS